MTNRFAPPAASVEDAASSRRSSWPKLFFVIVLCGIVALVLSWFVTPWVLVATLPSAMTQGSELSAAYLAADVGLSMLSFAACCLLAIVLTPDKQVIAAFGVAFIGWIVYFAEVGGLQGMLSSQYPQWYEFFPAHFGAAALALLVSKRHAV